MRRRVSSIFSIAWALCLTARRKDCSTTRRFGGTLYHRTAFAGATTGQQLLYALDEQVRRRESEDKVKKFEGATFLSAVIDEGGVCRGICAMDLRSMEVKTYAADAVIFATGGNGAIFGRSTNSVVCTGSAQAALFQQGVDYANGEFIQVHPTAIPGEDKLRLMSESARGEGGRVWVPRNPGEKRATRSIPEAERFIFSKSGIRSTGILFRAILPRVPFTASCIRKNSVSTGSRRCIWM